LSASGWKGQSKPLQQVLLHILVLYRSSTRTVAQTCGCTTLDVSVEHPVLIVP